MSTTTDEPPLRPGLPSGAGVTLDGAGLTVEDVVRLADGTAAPSVPPTALERVRRSWRAAQRLAAAGRLYGRATGVGAHRSVPVGPDDEADHGLRLLRSHAGGAGAPLPARQVRAMLAVRANQLLAGGSGIHPDIVHALVEALRLGHHPEVPEYGGLGTGDLTALAATGLTLLGERPWLPDTPSPRPDSNLAATPDPGAAPASVLGLDPGAVLASAPGAAPASAAGAVSASVLGPDPGGAPAFVLGPDPGGAPASAPDAAPASVPGPVPGGGPASVPGPVSGGGPASVPGPVPGGGPASVPGPVSGGGPASAAGPVPGGVSASVPGPVPGGVSASGPGPDPGAAPASVPGPDPAPASVPGPDPGAVPASVLGPVPGAVPAPVPAPDPGAALTPVPPRPIPPLPAPTPAPVRLRPGDALALLSSNALVLGQAALASHALGALLRATHAVAALSLAAVSGSPEAYAAPVHALRPYPGAARAAAEVRRLLGLPERPAGSGRRIQDPYGFRAFPQVHGATLDAADALRRIVETEINCPTENPLIALDGTAAYHHGGFYAAPLALALDALNLALLQTAQLSAARLTGLGRPDLTGLPAFLATGPAGSSGTMILEYTATSALAELRTCATPASAGHAVLSHGLEEAAGFASQSARQTLRAADAYRTVLACELVTAVRALRLHPAPPRLPVLAVAAASLPAGTEDRPLTTDLARAQELLMTLAEL